MGDEYKVDLSSKRKKVSIDQIVLDLAQPRRKFEKNSLGILAKSISEYGLLSPPTVMETTGREFKAYLLSRKDLEGSKTRDEYLATLEDDRTYYRVVVGHRRTLASRKAGLKKIEVEVLNKQLTVAEIRTVQLDEASQKELTDWRKALHVANQYKLENEKRRNQKKTEMSVSQFSFCAGYSEETVRAAIRYTHLSSPVRKLVEDRAEMPYKNATLVALLPLKGEQYDIAYRYGRSPYENLRKVVYDQILKDARVKPAVIKKAGLATLVRSIEEKEQKQVKQEEFAVELFDKTYKSLSAAQRKEIDSRVTEWKKDSKKLSSLSGEAGKEAEFKLKRVGIDYSEQIKNTRDQARQVKEEVLRILKLSKIDPNFNSHVLSSVRSDVPKIMELFYTLEERLKPYTNYMEDLNSDRPSNGNRLDYQTIDDALEELRNFTAKIPRKLKGKKTVREMVHISKIRENPDNPRGKFTEDDVKDLVVRIDRDGKLLNELWTIDRKSYRFLFDGHRRKKACEVLIRKGKKQYEYLPCITFKGLTKTEQVDLERYSYEQVKFTDWEIALGLLDIWEEKGAKGIDEIAEALDIDKQKALDLVKYEKMVAPEIKVLVGEGLVSMSSALLFVNKNLRIRQKGQATPLNFDQQVELAYDAVLRGETSGSRLRKKIQDYTDRRSDDRRMQQSDIFEIIGHEENSADIKQAMYARQADYFNQAVIKSVSNLIATLSAEGEGGETEYAALETIVSQDRHIMLYLSTIKKLLSEAYKRAENGKVPVKEKPKPKKPAKRSGKK